MYFKKIVAILFLLALLLTGSFMVQQAQAATVSVDFLNVESGDILNLEVGEEIVFEVEVEADETFTYALMLSDEQFPGKGIKLHGADIVTKDDKALLSLTATGKGSTAELPGGVAPVSLVVGIRYAGGIVYAEWIDFFIRVP